MEEPGADKSSEAPATGTRPPDNPPTVALGPSQQPPIIQPGGLQSYLVLAAGQPVTALRGAGLNVVPLGNNLSILQANGLYLPFIQAGALQSLPGLSAGATPTTSQAAGGLPSQIFQLGGLQPSAVQAVLKAVGGLQAPPPGLPSSGQSSVHMGPASLQPLPTLAGEVQSRGLLPVSYELPASAKPSSRATPDARKKSAKSKSEVVTYANVACSAYSVPRVKHTATNTAKVNKSVSTQANISLRNKSQGVQCPEGGASQLRVLQESCAQAEESEWAGQEADLSLQRSVMFVQDGGPVGNVLPAYEAWQADKLFLQDLRRIQRHRYRLYEPGQVQFDDVAVYFSKEEWESLRAEEQDLYMETMVKNYRALHSLGWITVKPPLIAMIERGEDPYVRYPGRGASPRLPGLSRDPTTVKTDNPPEESYDLHKFSERLRRSIDDFLTFCIQQTEDVMSGADLSAQSELGYSGSLCPVDPSLGPKPALEERPFRCLRCERRFKRFCDLVSHQKFHPFQSGFACFQCATTFKNAKALTKHELAHTGEKPFICSRCGKRFFTQRLLDNHLGVTLKKNPYACSECGKRFAKKYVLRKHEMVHNRDKPFLCSICGKGFTEEEDFNEHQRVHMEEHVHSCDSCGKRFSSKNSFEKHRQEHAALRNVPDYEQQGQLLLLRQIQEGESVLPKELELQS